MRRTGLALVIALCSLTAAAQMTARQVVDHNLEARGGAEGFATIHSLSFTGILQFGSGQSAPMSVWLTTQPARIRIEILLPAGKMIEAYDGTHAWQMNPGSTTAVVLHGASAWRVRDRALSGADLLPNPDAKLRLAGAGTRAGHRYYVISYALATGDVFTQSIDSVTWLSFHETYPGGEEEVADYQRTGGLLLPTKLICGGAQPTTLVIQHTAFNTPIPAARFQMPAPPKPTARAATKPGRL